MIPVSRRETQRPSPQDPSIRGAVAMVAALFAVLTVLSYPLASLALGVMGLTVWAASKSVSLSLPTGLRNRTRRLTIPGLGTLEYRLTDR